MRVVVQLQTQNPQAVSLAAGAQDVFSWGLMVATARAIRTSTGEGSQREGQSEQNASPERRPVNQSAGPTQQRGREGEAQRGCGVWGGLEAGSGTGLPAGCSVSAGHSGVDNPSWGSMASQPGPRMQDMDAHHMGSPAIVLRAVVVAGCGKRGGRGWGK